PKMLPLIVKKCDKVVGFKAESGVDKLDLVKEARESLNRNFLSAVVANDLKDVQAGSTKVIFVRSRYQSEIEGSKAEVAHKLIEELARI
ncbi:MAG: bifunctional phosphopantothenoylcysteine decarboxylase/phosphopantothenate--cysteine ligase CoaBC, partial [Methanomassiliicoccales archaeon]|nr:bifunctional phosphopantothenoylcysteine decarboxylase/phosphopantothenate--cysteine ligase CoaBC [Methanomassiliicoccales archaeon]